MTSFLTYPANLQLGALCPVHVCLWQIFLHFLEVVFLHSAFSVLKSLCHFHLVKYCGYPLQSYILTRNAKLCHMYGWWRHDCNDLILSYRHKYSCKTDLKMLSLWLIWLNWNVVNDCGFPCYFSFSPVCVMSKSAWLLHRDGIPYYRTVQKLVAFWLLVAEPMHK